VTAVARTTALEAALRRERAWILLSLAVAAGASWVWMVPTALDMYGRMEGPAAWMMQGRWDLRYAALIFLMWATMMVGMMLPSAAPTILSFARIVRSSATADAPVARSYAFAAGYLLAWTAFSAAATLVQWALSSTSLLSPMMQAAAPWLSAVILLAAGIYQWTPAKQTCLLHCRSPLDYLARHWRRGIGGALRMGVEHGFFCIGCCWALMLLLFAGGVMSLPLIGALTGLVLLEKAAPHGVLVGRAGGSLLAAAGVWLLVGA
jgi:predicted metal-binding membrane protein